MDDKHELAVAEAVKEAMASVPNTQGGGKVFYNQGGVQGEYLINPTFAFPNATSEQIVACLQGMMNVPHCTGNELSGLSRQYYHLFVLAEEYYNKGVFSVAKGVTFKYTKDDIWKRYCRFDPVALQELMGMPAILATKNWGQGKTGDNHTFCLAKIDRITDQGESFSMEFRTDGNDRKQQVLNDHCKEMGFCYSSMRTELDEIHWAIKEGDLLGLLGGLGI